VPIVLPTVGPSFGRTGLAFLAAAFGLLASDRAHAADTTPPNPVDLVSPANGAWCSATCALTWTMATDAVPNNYPFDTVMVTSYQIFLDGVLKADVTTSPYDVTASYTPGVNDPLLAGWHTWYVVAKDSSGNLRQSTSTFSVQIDASAPTAPALVSPASAAWVGTAAPTFSWTASTDAGSGLASYEIWIDGASQTTGLSSTATSAQASIPPKSIFLDGFDTCSGWTMAPIPPSSYNWSCDLQNDIQSYALNIYALATSGTIGSTATSGPIDLSNVGTARLALHESICGAKTYQISISDGSAVGFRLLRDTPGTNCRPWINSSLPIDDFTGGISSAIQFAGVATAFNGVFVDSVEIQGVTGGTYTWQVVAVDLAGNRTPSENRTLRYDLPPVPFDIVGPSGWSATATPTFSWNATTDAGSGLAKYQVWIDGALAIDNISATATSVTATAALADGAHTWQTYAVDAAGAFRRSRQKPALSIDTLLPQSFSLATPADGTLVVSPTPSLCWNSTGDTGSGLDHYDLLIDGAVVRGGVTDLYTGQICATPTAAIVIGAHTWNARAVDKAGNTQHSTETWTIYFGVVPEPSRDAGADAAIDAPMDAATDGPSATATSTSTATSTLTTTGTATATSTSTVSSTATGTSVPAEPRPDGAPMVGADAPIFVADAASSDASGARDTLPIDSLLSTSDAWTAPPGPDTATGSTIHDGGIGLADALVAITVDAKMPVSDGGRSGTVDGSGYDAGAAGKSGASGCGCAVGGRDAGTAWGVPLMILGLLAFWRGSRLRRRGRRTGQG